MFLASLIPYYVHEIHPCVCEKDTYGPALMELTFECVEIPKNKQVSKTTTHL